jgi:mono/diheme cytochrome c family protein
MMVMGCGSNKAGSDGTDSPIDSGDDGTTGGDDSGTSGTDDSGTDTAEEASIARGAEIVQEVCSHCHDSGALAKRVVNLDDDTIASVIENGFGAMPPQNLDAQQVADVIAYLRANSPNDAPIGRGPTTSSPAAP